MDRSVFISASAGALLAVALVACDQDGPAGERPRSNEVRLALLGTPADGQPPDAGCDALVYESFRVPDDAPPLQAALEKLFSLETERVRGYRHFLARTADTLRLVRVERAEGTARIHLTGELRGLRGVCDDPRAAIQIRHTALQVEGVERVELYLDGRPTDLRPDARGDAGKLKSRLELRIVRPSPESG